MPDKESRSLDQEILGFIDKYHDRKAPEMAFEWLALKIFAYQFRRNAPYGKFCRLEKKIPGQVRCWKEIPALPALAFKELVLTTFPFQKRVRVFRSSGTTGGASATKASADASLRSAHFFDTLRLYERSIIPPFRKYLLPDRVSLSYYFLISFAQEDAHSSLSYMMQVVDRRLAEDRGKFYVNNGVPQFKKLATDLAREKKKVFLLTTAFALKGFFDFLIEKKIKLCLAAGSRLMETGGFKGRTLEISKKELYAQCKKYLGIPGSHCVSEYGMTELSSQIYDTTLLDFSQGKKRKPVKKGPAWFKTLVIDPRTGREARKGSIGFLRHVDLANRGSVIAVQTEDMGRASGDGFQLLGRSKGSEPRGCSLRYEEFIRRGGS